MKIWIHTDGRQQGPYDYDQLSRMGIAPSTPVWYDGLPGWMPASQAPATATLFGEGTTHEAGDAPLEAVPPQMVQPKPPTYIGWSIVLTLLCCSPVAILAIVTGAISSSRYNHGDVDGSRRMSNLTEWLLILTIVLAMFTLPLGWVSMLV